MSESDEIRKLSREGLLEHFSRTRILRYVVIAVGVHVVLITVTSVPTLRAWVDEDYARQREQAQSAVAQPEAEDPSDQPGEPAPDDSSDASTGGDATAGDAGGPEETGGDPGDGDAEGEAADDGEKAPIERELEETAPPPDPGDDLGISLDETNG
ncbi:MAG: hypothetical protein R3336_00515 [Phycisphaeraceae bacterium]|nr:hypothetical protein [Phycisphaeraceae bacterium]